MSDTVDTPTPETPATPPTASGRGCKGDCRRHGRRGGLRRFFGASLFIGALVAVPLAVAQASGHGFGGCHGGHGAPESAEELRGRMDRGASFFYDRVDATAEQEEAIDAVLDRLAPELFALDDARQALREGARDALTAEQIDAARVEELRQDGLELADQASRILVGGVVDVARILSPEQRQELAEAAERFHKR